MGRSTKKKGKPISKRRLIRRSKELLKEARGLLRRKGKRISEPARSEVQARVEALSALIPSARRGVRFHYESLHDAAIALDAALTTHLGHFRKSVTRELIEAVVWAVGLALFIRFFLIEAFSIPSGSMIPTLEIGDHLFINKIEYGLYWPMSAKRAIEWAQPSRGDVIVFIHDDPGSPHDGKDYIKRVIALPGDRVRLVDNVIYLNGEPLPTEIIPNPDAKPGDLPGERDCPIYIGDNAEEPWRTCRCVQQRETNGDATYITQHIVDRRLGCRSDMPDPEDWPHRERPGEGRYFGYQAMNPDWPDVVVPEGHVFVMGDNRDRSEDGRFWGFVPFDRIKGSAFVVWWARDTSRFFSWID